MAVRSVKGSTAADVVIAAAMVVFVLLPVFSTVVEKYILNEKYGMIKDAVDITGIAVYNALITGSLGRVYVDVDRPEALDIFKELLEVNLGLDKDLNPKEGSIAEGQVVIKSLEIYTSGFPVRCPENSVLDKPTVHSCINVPVKPSLYRKLILDLLGRDHIGIELHVDSEIPVNN